MAAFGSNEQPLWVAQRNSLTRQKPSFLRVVKPAQSAGEHHKIVRPVH